MESKKTLYMSENGIYAFLEAEAARGIGAAYLRITKRCLMRFYHSLPNNKLITQERIATWKQALETRDYAKSTIETYVRCINRYLEFEGRKDLKCITHRFDDLTGRQFGDLTVLDLTDERKRRYCVWRCRCVCGKEKNVSSGDLVSGNVTSCGCKKTAMLMEGNWYFEGTKLRQALREKVESTHASSGFTGVTLKRNKWLAYITYKKKRYYLGTYENLEDAVAARARAKEAVQEDAKKLLKLFEESKAKNLPEPANGIKK